MATHTVSIRRGVRIPLRDGVHLAATLYLPEGAPAPAVFTLTPYVGQTFHERGMYFAANGLVFVTVDVRGRGDSDGKFIPFVHDGEDAYDVVEWLANQSFCTGRISMWGGSYGGLSQWTAARTHPPHLSSIVPVASPYLGVDFPMRNNIPSPYVMQWLMLVSGRTSQDKLFAEQGYWAQRYREWLVGGTPFRKLDDLLELSSAVFQEWLTHPCLDHYWDARSPSATEYSQMTFPVLTITGIYDGDQPGALMHYQQHLKNASPEARARHFLVIGPWDHAGTRTPKREFAGLRFGPESLLDVARLHLEWYQWTLRAGPKPEFLRRAVAYYVIGAEQWRYADSLESVTGQVSCWYLHSDSNASGVFRSGVLRREIGAGACDTYTYDPRDVAFAQAESTAPDPLCMRPTFPTDNLTDQQPVYANEGKVLIYHSEPFLEAVEISGFFRLAAWLAIDQPDTDFQVTIYAIDSAGGSVLLTADWMRARYRQSLREEQLITTREPLRYDFERFTFTSHRLAPGSRLRLVIGPINSIYSQKNYNSGGVVSDETSSDARPVVVRLFHDEQHPSALYVPLGQPG